MSQNILLISVDVLKDRTNIHGNIDEKLLYADIKVAQDMYIFPLLGTALYNKIQAYISANDWTGGADYKTLLDSYLIDCLVWYTLSESPETMSYQITNKGVVRKQGDNTQLPSMSEIISLADTYKKRAEFYANRARLYLQQNAPLKFPEYLNPGSGIDDKRPIHTTYTSGMWLGAEYPPHRTYEEKYQGNRPYCDEC
jgi:hypothetical protein